MISHDHAHATITNHDKNVVTLVKTHIEFACLSFEVGLVE